MHQRTLTLATDGTRLDGEDLFLAADGGALRSSQDHYTVRFHLHPLVKATRLTDGHGVLLMMPNKEVWTFSAGDHHILLEDSVYLAGNDGPRRAAQMVIKGQARSAPRVSWSFRNPIQRAAQRRHAAPHARERTEAAAVNEQFRCRVSVPSCSTVEGTAPRPLKRRGSEAPRTPPPPCTQAPPRFACARGGEKSP